MATDWETVITASAVPWHIPPTVLTEFGALILTADTALAAAKMRDIKKRYFLTPPLTEADYIALGLKPHDSTLTASGTPTAQVTVETYLVGRHELGVKMIYVIRTAADPANKGYRIWYSVVAPGETPLAGPDGLRKSFFTKRKKDVIEFDFGDSGKTAYFAVQIENEGKKGCGGRW
jgi:hypothetical protein